MGIKFLCIALVAILSVQGLVEAKHISSIEERGIIEDVAKVVEEIKGSVTKLIVEGIAAVKKAHDQIVAIIQQEVNKAMAEIQQLLAETIADIKEFEKVAAELGYDIKECVEEQLPRIEALAKKTQEGVAACMADTVAEFTKMYEALLEATTASYDAIFALVQKFDECQDWDCRGEVAKELVQEMMRINSETRIIVDNAVREMQQQLPAVIECIRGQIAAYKVEAEAISADIKACVEASGQTQALATTKNVEDEINKLIAHVKQVIEEVINTSVAELKKAHDAIVAFAKQLIADARAKIHELAAKLHADIEAIKKEAEELGYDIKECVEAALPKIEALIAQTEAEINACIEETLSSAAEIYDKVVAIVNEVQAEVVALIETVQGCKDIVCYIEAAKNFYNVLERIAGEVNELIGNANEELQAAIEALIKCAEPTMQNYVQGMQQITEEVKQCLLS